MVSDVKRLLNKISPTMLPYKGKPLLTTLSGVGKTVKVQPNCWAIISENQHLAPHPLSGCCMMRKAAPQSQLFRRRQPKPCWESSRRPFDIPERRKLLISMLKISAEEQKHRRQLTNFAVKLMLLAGGIALVVQLFYYFLVISPIRHAARSEFPLQIFVTIAALGPLAIMLGVNCLKTVPYWAAAILFLVALTVLALFSDTPHEISSTLHHCSIFGPFWVSGYS